MVFKVKYSDPAALDLAEIIKYISVDLCNSQAAERFLGAVGQKLVELREYPYKFPLYHDEKLRAEGIRFIVIGNYLLFYIVDDSKKIVTIVRILYGKQDIPSVFDQ
ncbi:MAG: type II toxin-antitoxin system RelE/ParE family toxin [Lachnospiraceae bacterium]|nr:type II toxin-antitoxin system RelE/ParE family toxin [Lachnospiraceae bacterium]